MSRYSNSYINQFQSCPLSCHYRYDLKLRPVEGNTHDLAWGHAFHKALEVIYLEGDLPKAQDVFRLAYPVQLDPNDFAKTQENGVWALEKYVENYHWDKNWRVVSTEEMDSTEDGFVVKLDLVIEDTDTGSLYGCDHKTTKSYLDYRYFGRFNPNSQITQYVRYIKERYGRCDGFIVNAVRVYYMQRKSAQRAAGAGVEFERVVLNRTEQQIEQEQESKNYWIDRVEHAKSTGVWGMNTNNCWRCEFQEACSAGWDWENDEELILNTYRQVCEKWVPEKDGHCLLEWNHEGEHDPSLPALVAPVEFQVNV